MILEEIKSLVRNTMVENVEQLIKNNLLYTLDISRMMWVITPIISKIFKNIPVEVEVSTSNMYTEDYSIGYYAVPLRTRNSGTTFCVYRGTLIIMRIQFKENKQGIERRNIYLSTIRTKRDISNLKRFIDVLVKKGVNDQSNLDNRIILHSDTGGSHMLPLEQARTFNDVFIPLDQKILLMSSVDAFIAKRDWYFEHNIPYHFGIMLYGIPGSGKTSVAQAIASYIKADLHIIQGDRIEGLPYMMRNEISTDTGSKHRYQIILVEDIDCGFISSQSRFLITDDNKPKDDAKQSGFASILNAIDGIGATANTIWMFTTNHIERLDPALIRPGRIDLKLEIGEITLETLNMFLKNHYDKEYTGDLSIKKGLTFAMLQTEVMRGKSFEEIIDICKEVI